MSYCRHNGITSDVYLYHDINDGIICMQCLLLGDCVGHVLLWSQKDALAHLTLHREAGHRVPGHAFSRLRREWKESAPQRKRQKQAALRLFARSKRLHEQRVKKGRKQWDKMLKPRACPVCRHKESA